MGNIQYFKQAARVLHLVARQGVAKTASNLSKMGENGIGLAMIIGKEIG
jgi:hypothetical protein